MYKYKTQILLVLIIGLCILNIQQYRSNRVLSIRIEKNAKNVIGTGTRFIPKDWVLSVIQNNDLDLNSLYRLYGYLEASQGYITLANHSSAYTDKDISMYLWQTIKDVEALIKLIESGADSKKIEELKEVITNNQINIIKKYHPDFEIDY